MNKGKIYKTCYVVKFSKFVFVHDLHVPNEPFIFSNSCIPSRTRAHNNVVTCSISRECENVTLVLAKFLGVELY